MVGFWSQAFKTLYRINNRKALPSQILRFLSFAKPKNDFLILDRDSRSLELSGRSSKFVSHTPWFPGKSALHIWAFKLTFFLWVWVANIYGFVFFVHLCYNGRVVHWNRASSRRNFEYLEAKLVKISIVLPKIVQVISLRNCYKLWAACDILIDSNMIWNC